MTQTHRPLALIIFDGWGYSESAENNAILAANTPNWDRMWATYPHTLINASGEGVGLPGDQMGNSEVGHLNLGAGRVVYQEFTRISLAIRNGEFFDNRVLIDAVDKAKKTDSAVHIFGLLSDGGVHSHEQHIHAMVELAARQGAKQVYVHAFLDGRDTPPKSAEAAIEELEKSFKKSGTGRLGIELKKPISSSPKVKANIMLTQGLKGYAQHMNAKKPMSLSKRPRLAHR
jgi:2,3-bisphosphoglycerate-independent phosphoglycerate mutase